MRWEVKAGKADYLYGQWVVHVATKRVHGQSALPGQRAGGGWSSCQRVIATATFNGPPECLTASWLLEAMYPPANFSV